MNTVKNIKLFLLATLFMPIIAYGQSLTLTDMLNSIKDLIGQAIPIVFGMALLFFFWGVALYILRAGDVAEAEKGKSIMIYGVVAMFVLVSIAGIIKFIGGNLGIQPGNISDTSKIKP